ncbi:MAG: NAD(P)-dependent oxidoreductase, partial [Candidatus Omnitrophota bacterium]
LILGASGVVGFHLAEHLQQKHEVMRVARTSKKADYQMDVSDFGALSKLVAKTKPDALINAVKPPLSTDEIEEKREVALKMNALLPQKLAEMQKIFGYALLHISTDWVYEGKEGEAYSEESPVHPQNYYTQTKLEGERLIAKASSDFLIARTEGVFGIDEKGSNPFLRLKACAENGKPFVAPTDQFSQPICGAELARLLGILLETKKAGIYNVAGPDYVSRYEFATMVCEELGWKCDVQASLAKERRIKIPKCLRLDLDKVKKDAGEIMPLRKQIACLRGFLHERGI